MASKKHVFSAIETHIFTDILKKYKGTIENKETDGMVPSYEPRPKHGAVLRGCIMPDLMLQAR